MPAPRVRDDLRTLSGIERAATFILAINQEHSTKILGMMAEDEIRELLQVMANLGNVSSDLLEKLFEEFVSQMSSTGMLSGNIDATERLLLKVFDQDRVKALMDDIRGPAGRTMWDKLSNVNEAVLANFLKNEYPQTVAVVMSKIRPENAARILSILPENFALEVVMRMLRMETVQKDVLEDVERTLRNEFMNNLARSNRRDPNEAMAEIFNNLDNASEARFISGLEERNKDMAEKIKSLMFTFRDLVRLDSKGMQAVMKAVDKSKLPIALKNADETIKSLFFSNMSERAGKLLAEEIASLGPIRMKDIEEAQSAIVSLARELAARGEVLISRDSNDDKLVY